MNLEFIKLLNTFIDGILCFSNHLSFHSHYHMEIIYKCLFDLFHNIPFLLIPHTLKIKIYFEFKSLVYFID